MSEWGDYRAPNARRVATVDAPLYRFTLIDTLSAPAVSDLSPHSGN